MQSPSSGLRRILLLAFCVAGIWAAYIYQGVLQETVSTKRFGSDKKRFEHLAFLNLAQNVVCLIWSFLMIKIWSDGGNGGAPWWSYWSAGITNTIGPAMGIEALKYISYPAQVLAKSSKMIPVMLMGTLVYGIKYTFPEYFCTLLVAGGVSGFALLKTSSKTIRKLARPNAAPLGYGLCFLNLAFDGFTNATQDSITARYRKQELHDTLVQKAWEDVMKIRNKVRQQIWIDWDDDIDCDRIKKRRVINKSTQLTPYQMFTHGKFRSNRLWVEKFVCNTYIERICCLLFGNELQNEEINTYLNSLSRNFEGFDGRLKIWTLNTMFMAEFHHHVFGTGKEISMLDNISRFMSSLNRSSRAILRELTSNVLKECRYILMPLHKIFH